jgi:hypothetical protein
VPGEKKIGHATGQCRVSQSGTTAQRFNRCDFDTGHSLSRLAPTLGLAEFSPFETSLLLIGLAIQLMPFETGNQSSVIATSAYS